MNCSIICHKKGLVNEAGDGESAYTESLSLSLSLSLSQRNKPIGVFGGSLNIDDSFSSPQYFVHTYQCGELHGVVHLSNKLVTFAEYPKNPGAAEG